MRRLRALIAGLPPHESALARAIDPQAAPWTVEAELAAQAIEGLDVLRYVLQAAHSKKGAQLEPPKVVTRPERYRPAPDDNDAADGGEVVERRGPESPAELEAFLMGGAG